MTPDPRTSEGSTGTEPAADPTTSGGTDTTAGSTSSGTTTNDTSDPTTGTDPSDGGSSGGETGAEETGAEETGDSEGGAFPPAPRVWVATLDEADTFEVTDAFALSGGPADIDWSTFGLLHDGGLLRLYFLSNGEDSVHQFGFNAFDDAFEYGYESIDNLPIVGAPGDANTSAFGMAYDGSYALYMLSNDHATAYGFGFDDALDVYSYGFNAPGSTAIEGAPAGIDWSGWGVAGSGGAATLYAFASEDHDALAQFERSGNTFSYVDAPLSLDLSRLEGSPTTDFAVVHDGGSTRLYFVEAD